MGIDNSQPSLPTTIRLPPTMNIRRMRCSRFPADSPFEQKATHYTFGELRARFGGRKPSALSDAAISVSVLRSPRSCSMCATSS